MIFLVLSEKLYSNIKISDEFYPKNMKLRLSASNIYVQEMIKLWVKVIEVSFLPVIVEIY